MSVTAVIASMNRALQCESLLRSLADLCTGIDRTVVIARTTGAFHAAAYERLVKDYPTVEFIPDRDGYSHALGGIVGELQPHHHLCLMVDDQVFFRPADFRAATRCLAEVNPFVWSWRLGFDPGVCRLHGDFWLCTSAKDDYYGYPFHSDGALFRVSRWREVLDAALPGWNVGAYIPNDLEAAGAQYMRRSPLFHAGPLEAACATWQINKESTTRERYSAAWQGVPATDLDALARAFLAGKRVATQTLYALDGPHVGVRGHVPATRAAVEFYASLIR